MIEVMTRPQCLAEDIVVLDGFSNAGKSLLAPVISSFERCELWRINPLYDNLCLLDAFKKVERDASSTLVKLFADMDLYNLIIGRNVNFRADDDTGVHKNLQGDRYKKRLDSEGGDYGTKVIDEKTPILILMTHCIFEFPDLLFDSYKERLKTYIIMVRHPLHLVMNWFSSKWHERIGIDKREFQLCYEKNGTVFPWYAHSWEKKYRSLHPLEKAIMTICSLDEGIRKRYKELGERDRDKVLFVPFEKLLTHPNQYFDRIMGKLSTKKTALTDKVLEEVRLPRYSDNHYLEKLKHDFKVRMEKEIVSEELKKILKNLCSKYEETYLRQ
jgi:hypothetical protein